ncbi:MAG: nucleotidyltransferase domain-containing protein, partial [Bacteroidota bacterium]
KCLNEMGVSIKQVILFGSRARGDYSKNSDFLIITERTFGFKEKMQIASATRRALAELYVYADIVINSEEEVEIKKGRIGCVTRYALKEGIKI